MHGTPHIVNKIPCHSCSQNSCERHEPSARSGERSALGAGKEQLQRWCEHCYAVLQLLTGKLSQHCQRLTIAPGVSCREHLGRYCILKTGDKSANQCICGDIRHRAQKTMHAQEPTMRSRAAAQQPALRASTRSNVNVEESSSASINVTAAGASASPHQD